MFILHIDTETGFRGGQQQVLWLMEGLRARGIGQSLLTAADSELGKRASAAGHDVIRLNYTRAWSPFAWREVSRAAKGKTLLHAHASHAHRLAWHAVGGRVPLVVTRRVDFAVGKNWLSRRVYGGPGQRFIAISWAINDILIEGTVPRSSISVVHSGVKPDRLAMGGGDELKRALNLHNARPLIGCTAALVDHKDPLNLVEALAIARKELPEAAVLWAGEGDLREAVEARVHELGLREHFVLAGHMQDVGALLDAVDLFVMPSKMEGLCTSLIDAQARGIPCVATRAGGIPDVIEDGVNGFLARPEDPPALADAIIRLWRDKKKRVAFSEAGPRVFAERFTVDRMVEGTLAVYREFE